MATMLGPTLERLQQLELAGITGLNFKRTVDDALAAAEKCDIGEVLRAMMGAAEEVDVMSRLIDGMELRRDENATGVRRLVDKLEGQAVEDVLAILKAKQCKCW